MNFLKLFTLFILIATSNAFAQQSIKHKVVKGETIYAIAREYKITVNKIYELNPTIKGTTLKVGDFLQLPITTSNQTTNIEETPQFHKVAKGDSFYAISKKYNLSLEQLEQLNPNLKSNDLKIGTVVAISEKEENVVVTKETKIKPIVISNENNVVSKDSTFTTIHIIQPKETKYGITKKYGISIHELETLNPKIPSDFPVGYQLIIQKDQVVDVNNTAEVLNDTVNLSTDEEVMVENLSKKFNSKADLLIDKASQYIGIRYKYGGTTPKGFDCSGLMCTTFEEIDLSLPRTSSGQATYGEKIDQSESQKGDLIFFATGRKNRISHVGMITEVKDDEIKFIHASTSSGVMISSSKEPYYASRLVQINRVLNDDIN